MPAGDNTDRIEDKLDLVNLDIRELTKAIHEQSVSIVRLCEQMNHSTEALGRAHHRIDSVHERVEMLRDLPTRMDYLEKRVEAVEHRQELSGDQSTGNALELAKSLGMRQAVSKLWPYIILGSVIVALGIIGKLTAGG